jgi:putative phage-type endonuclease
MDVEALAGTASWFAARRGLLTASRIADALAVLKNGKPSESRRKLMFDLLAERMSGVATEHYVTPAMQWGIDNQAGAIASYEAETGDLVGPEVFVIHPRIDWFGATPDGLVGADGLIEVKCPTTPKHLTWVMAGEVPDEHQPQMLAQLACTGRQWVDFVSFDPRVRKPQLFIRRFQPDRAEIERIEAGAREFLDELAAMERQLEAA